MAENTKSLQDILINVTRHDVRDKIHNAGPTAANLKMADKLNEYIAKPGYTNAHIYNIALRLLTKGKVRLQFRGYIERLELASQADKMYRMEAVAAIDEFLGATKHDDEDTGITQKIILNV